MENNRNLSNVFSSEPTTCNVFVGKSKRSRTLQPSPLRSPLRNPSPAAPQRKKPRTKQKSSSRRIRCVKGLGHLTIAQIFRRLMSPEAVHPDDMYGARVTEYGDLWTSAVNAMGKDRLRSPRPLPRQLVVYDLDGI